MTIGNKKTLFSQLHAICILFSTLRTLSPDEAIEAEMHCRCYKVLSYVPDY